MKKHILLHTKTYSVQHKILNINAKKMYCSDNQERHLFFKIILYLVDNEK
jgi:hypothetical protein